MAGLLSTLLTSKTSSASQRGAASSSNKSVRLHCPHWRTSEVQEIGVQNQDFPQNLEKTAQATINESLKEYSHRTMARYPLIFTEDKTRENEFELYPEGFQLDLR